MKRDEMHVHDPTQLASPLVALFIGIWTAMSGARKGRKEEHRQAIKDERERADSYAADAKECRERCAKLQTHCDEMQIAKDASQKRLDDREAEWQAKHTSFLELSDLTNVPGAIAALRIFRDEYERKTATHEKEPLEINRQ